MTSAYRAQLLLRRARGIRVRSHRVMSCNDRRDQAPNWHQTLVESMILVFGPQSVTDRRGVFENEGETSYFYLYDTRDEGSPKILGDIHILTGAPDFEERDVSIRWNPDERIVGLFIRRQLWAAFDGTSGQPYGGNYRSNAIPTIPAEIAGAFATQ